MVQGLEGLGHLHLKILFVDLSIERPKLSFATSLLDFVNKLSAYLVLWKLWVAAQPMLVYPFAYIAKTWSSVSSEYQMLHSALAWVLHFRDHQIGLASLA